jgi:hypothetical protein
LKGAKILEVRKIVSNFYGGIKKGVAIELVNSQYFENADFVTVRTKFTLTVLVKSVPCVKPHKYAQPAF